MKRKRRLLAWLLIAVLFVVSGSLAAFAAGETTELSETEEADEGEALDIGEAQEEMEATPADITGYFSEIGQADGYSVWLRRRITRITSRQSSRMQIRRTKQKNV